MVTTFQIIPHLTAAIQEYIKDAGSGFDVHIVEIGGTVGDLESQSFVEAIREFGMRVGSGNVAYVHVVYMPYLNASKETKTKPAQNSVRDLRGLGITPDILVARSESMVSSPSVRAKLSLFSGVNEEAIALLPNAKSIYEVPLTLEDTGIADVLCRKLDLPAREPELGPWRDMVARSMLDQPGKVTVGVVAKYMDNQDTYMCVFEALRAAGWWNDASVDIRWVDAEALETSKDVAKDLAGLDGIVVPGGFGTRGLEGKITGSSIRPQ